MSYEERVTDLINKYEADRGALEEQIRHRMIVSAQDMDRLTNYLNVEKVRQSRKEDENGDEN